MGNYKICTFADDVFLYFIEKTITVGPGYLGLALDDEGNIDDLLYGCREAFNNEGISKEWKVTSVAGRQFSPTLLLEKSKGVDYYELQFEKNVTELFEKKININFNKIRFFCQNLVFMCLICGFVILWKTDKLIKKFISNDYIHHQCSQSIV